MVSCNPPGALSLGKRPRCSWIKLTAIYIEFIVAAPCRILYICVSYISNDSYIVNVRFVIGTSKSVNTLLTPCKLR